MTKIQEKPRYNPLHAPAYKQAPCKPYPEIAMIPLGCQERPAWTFQQIGIKYEAVLPDIQMDKHLLKVPFGDSPDELLARNVQMARLRFGYYSTAEAHKASKRYKVPLLLFNALDTHRTLWLMRSRNMDLTALKTPEGAFMADPLQQIALATGFYNLPPGNGIPLPQDIADAIEDAIAFLWQDESVHDGPKLGKVELAARRLWDRIKPPEQPSEAPETAPEKKPEQGEGEKGAGILLALGKDGLWHKVSKEPKAPETSAEERERERIEHYLSRAARLTSETQGLEAKRSAEPSSKATLPSFFLAEPSRMTTTTPRREKDAVWADIRIIEPPRSIKCMYSDQGRNRSRALDEGVLFKYPHRWCLDKAVFGYTRKGAGMSILFDISGSMRVTYDDIQRILEEFPAMTIAMYSGNGTCKGNLYLVAKGGYRTSKVAMHKAYREFPFGSSNECDLPALKWLAKQKAPHYWVSDGGVTDRGDRVNSYASQQVYDFMLSHNIKQARSLGHMKEILEGKALAYPKPSIILMPD